jgi:hypothetical protein
VGATGTYRGLYINPTLTAVAGSWRSIEDTSNLIGAFSHYQSGSNMLNYFNGKLLLGSTTDTGNGQIQVRGNLSLENVGNKIVIKGGTNATLGSSVLVGGTVTVLNTAVTANSKIFLTVSIPGGTQGFLSYTISAGVSFTINSSVGLDTSTVNWFIVDTI